MDGTQASDLFKGGCVVECESLDDLAHHLKMGVCVPAAPILESLELEWAKADAVLRAVADCPDVDLPGDEYVKPAISDRPLYTRYQWPPTVGLWCMTEMHAASIFDSVAPWLAHSELDFRWVTKAERAYLIEHAVLPGAKSVPEDFRVFKAAEVHQLMATDKPVRYKELVALQGQQTAEMDIEAPVEDEPPAAPAFSVGSRNAAWKQASVAVRQAARYNNIVAFERREERPHHYDTHTQSFHHPMSKMLRKSTSDSTSDSVAFFPGQHRR